MPSRTFRLTVAVLALAATVALAVFSQPVDAVEVVGTGNVEVVSTNCATLQCNTVADGGELGVELLQNLLGDSRRRFDKGGAAFCR